MKVKRQIPAGDPGGVEGRRRWAWIESERKWLRVILLEDGETRDLAEDVLVDLDASGNLVA